MSEDRRLAVLRAIVQDYVQTSEPVGSKALLERHHLGVSAATVRNDMAALEEEGLIAAPHTSGRTGPHRCRLPAVRRPALSRQADERRRAVGHRARSSRARSTSTTSSTAPCGCSASLTRQVAVDAVPVADALLGAPRRAGAARAPTGCWSCSSSTPAGSSSGSSSIDADLLSQRRRAPSSRGCASRAQRRGASRPLLEAAARLSALPDRFDPADRDLVRSVARALDDALRRGARGARRARRHRPTSPGSAPTSR